MKYFADRYLKQHSWKRMTASAIVQEAATEAYTDPNPSADIQLMKDAYEGCIDSARHTEQECKKFLANLYEELSKEIHGAPWSGPSVKSTLSATNAHEHICFVAKVCEQKFGVYLEHS